MKKKIALYTTLIAAVLSLAACTISPITATLLTVSTAADSTVILIQTGKLNLTPTEEADALTYCENISTAATMSIAELGNAGVTPAVRYSTVAGYWAAVVLPKSDATVVAALQSIANNVVTLISELNVPPVVVVTTPPTARQNFKLSKADQNNLNKAQAHAVHALATAVALKAKLKK